jgi:hypothetical protein
MNQIPLYPLRFEPIYQYRLWGGGSFASTISPREVLYRSAEPVLKPELPQECKGTIPNIVFPTGIDRRDDIGAPDRFDVYYGMADDRIGVARLDLPDFLATGGVAAQPKGKV